MPVPVVNRTGGGGAIGYSHVKKQKPDGYSIIWNSNSISSTYHSGTLPFDYTAFDAVARVSVETPVIAVRADAPWKTLKELIDHAQANPGKVRIGNSGTGSHTHFSASALFATGGAKIIDVPFGEGQAVVNLLGSRIEGVVQLPAALVSHVKSGDLRVLAVLGSKRDPVFPDVPTANELGYAVTLDMWRGIAVAQGRGQADHRQAAGRDQANGRVAAVQGRRQGDRVRSGVPFGGRVQQGDRPRRRQAGAAHDRSGPEEEVASAQQASHATSSARVSAPVAGKCSSPACSLLPARSSSGRPRCSIWAMSRCRDRGSFRWCSAQP